MAEKHCVFTIQKQAFIVVPLHRIILLAGPTASGKSALACALAEKTGATIINADSQQLYRGLDILVAQPARKDHVAARHLLYSTYERSQPQTAVSWARLAAQTIQKEHNQHDRPIIVVGGTGLYFRALIEGFSPIPPISDTRTQRLRTGYQAFSTQDLYQKLSHVDAASAESIGPFHRNRLIRALIVFETTGRCFSDWKKEPRIPILPDMHFSPFLCMSSAGIARSAITQRFENMLQQGLVDEVRCYAQQIGSIPFVQPIGYEDILAYAQGKITREICQERVIIASCQYAKRQRTWFRTQWPNVPPQSPQEIACAWQISIT